MPLYRCLALPWSTSCLKISDHTRWDRFSPHSSVIELTVCIPLQPSLSGFRCRWCLLVLDDSIIRRDNIWTTCPRGSLSGFDRGVYELKTLYVLSARRPPFRTALCELTTLWYESIGVARILSGGALFLAKKVDNLFSRRPQRPSKYTSKSNPPSKNCPKNWLLLWLGVHFVSWGCTYTFSPVNYAWKFFLSPGGGAGAPTAPPGYAYVWKQLAIVFFWTLSSHYALWFDRM